MGLSQTASTAHINGALSSATEAQAQLALAASLYDSDILMAAVLGWINMRTLIIPDPNSPA